MSCRDCGDKHSRYDKKVPSNVDETGNRAQQVRDAPGFNAGPASDPFTSFFAAQKMTYEELGEQRRLHWQMIEQQTEQVFSQMTDAMRQIHVDELVAVVNCEKMSMPGMTSGQAIASLAEALERDDFSFVKDLYPGLKEVVTVRMEEVVSRKIPGRKKE